MPPDEKVSLVAATMYCSFQVICTVDAIAADMSVNVESGILEEGLTIAPCDDIEVGVGTHAAGEAEREAFSIELFYLLLREGKVDGVVAHGDGHDEVAHNDE